MATTIPNSLLKYSGTSSISDLLQSSSNGVNGVPLKSLGKTTRLGSSSLIRRRDLSVSALIKKGKKKDEHPWPEDADPNVKGGVLSHLSHFKPLKTKPKPVTLDFERPLMDLEKKIIDVSLKFFYLSIRYTFVCWLWDLIERGMNLWLAGAENGTGNWFGF